MGKTVQKTGKPAPMKNYYEGICGLHPMHTVGLQVFFARTVPELRVDPSYDIVKCVLENAILQLNYSSNLHICNNGI